MNVKSKLKIGNKILLTLDGNILEKDADFVLIDGKKHKYDIAYDMPSTIGVEVKEIQSDEVEFLYGLEPLVLYWRFFIELNWYNPCPNLL